MTRISVSLRVLSAALALFLLSPSARAAKEGFNWSLSDIAVEGRGDSLAVCGTWKFDDWNVEPSGAMVFSLALVHGGRTAPLTPVVVYGRKAAVMQETPVSGDPREISVRQLFSAKSFRFTEVIPRMPWMDTVKVVLSVSDWRKGRGLTLRSTSQRGAFTRGVCPVESMEFPWTVLEPQKGKEVSRSVELSCRVSFTGSATKYEGEADAQDPDFKRFVQQVRVLTSTRRIALQSVTLRVSVPPCGNDREAQRLSRSRAASFQSYLSRAGAWKCYGAGLLSGGEAWDVVREDFLHSPYAGDQRASEILSLPLGGEYVWNALAHEKPALLDWLRVHSFPGCGRAVLSVRFRSPSFSNPRFILPVYEDVPEVLSAWDLWYLSTDYLRGTTEWLDIVIDAAGRFPKDQVLCYNAVMALLDCGAVREASVLVRRLDRSLPEGEYAYAAWLYHTGEYEQCLKSLRSLTTKGAFYGNVYLKAKPFERWVECRVPWRPLER